MRTLLTTLVLLALFAIHVSAQVQPVPEFMNFQGRLTKPDGTPVADGTYSLRFSLWDNESGGNELWSQQEDAVTVRHGTFSVGLYPFSSLFDREVLFLEIKIGNDPPLTPRQWFASVPFAFKANTVADGSVTSASIMDGTILGEDIADGTITASNIADGTITASKLVGGGAPPTGAAGGDLSGNYPNPNLATKLSSLSKVSGGALTAAMAPSTLDQSQTSGTGQAYVPVWQSFTAGISGYLARVDIKGFSRNGNAQTVTITILTGEGFGGQVLGSQTMTFSGTDTYQVCTFNSAISITAGQKYTIMMSDYNHNIAVDYFGSVGDSYPGGRGDNSPGIDYLFKTYVAPHYGVGLGVTNPAGQLHPPYAGNGNQGILIGAVSDIGANNHAELFIAQPANPPHWPIQITRAGTTVYAVRDDGSVFSASSRRYKEHIAPLPDALERVLRMQAVTFDWKPEFGGKHDLGFVAEELGAIVPELVEWDTNSKEALGVRYDRIGVLAIEAVKEQQKQISTLQSENAALKQQMAELTARIRQIKAVQEIALTPDRTR